MSEKKNVYRFELIMDAGNGAQKAGDILIKAFAAKGNYIYIEPMIPAEISPPKRTPYSMSGAVIRISDKDINSIGSTTDLMLVEHEILLDRRLVDKEYEEGATVLLDMWDAKRNADQFDAAIANAKSLGLNLIQFETDDESKALIKELNGNGKNMYYMGMLAALVNAPVDEMRSLIKSTFKKLSPEILGKNIQIFENGLVCGQKLGTSVEIATPTDVSDEEKVLLDGNTALALGMIDAGIKMYCGYPITPASSIMHALAQLFPTYGGIVHQAEDEISAIGAAIGSYYAGVPTATATSGPGLSLKQEFIGLSAMTETPLIVIDVQRGGPSTGLPTKTEQSDLQTAIYGSHGDNNKIVISVADVVDCFYAPHVARYITEKTRTPVLILSDYQTSVTYKVIQGLKLNEMDLVDDISDEVLARFGLSRLPEIEMVKDNQSIPGDEGGMRRVTGLNTDAEGQVVYSSESAVRGHTIRNNKLHAVRDVLAEPEIFGDKEGDVLVVGWGSTRGVLEEAIEKAQAEGLKASGLHLKVVHPLPKGLKEIFDRFKTVRVIEVAYGDDVKLSPMSQILRSETLTDVKQMIATPSGRPVKPNEVVEKVKELV